jgi:hypothetical protein
MASNCRHVMPSGKECHGYALKGGPFCYFHSRLHQAARKPANAAGSIEIPVLEDRCAIQVTITQILRAIANNSIDRPRASLLLYGLQLALQSVDRNNWAIPIGTVEALSQTSDGDELAAHPGDEDEEDEDDEDDEDEESEENEESENSGSEADAAVDNEASGQREGEDVREAGSDQDKSANESEAGSGPENVEEADDDSENDDDEFAGETTEDLIAGLKYLDSIRRQAGLDP